MSLPDAKLAAFDVLADNDEGQPCAELAELGIEKVYPQEQRPGSAGKKIVSVSTLGGDVKNPDVDRVFIRIYVAPDTDADQAQADLDALVEAVEQRFNDTAGIFARGTWNQQWLAPPLDLLLGQLTLETARTD